MLFGRTIFLELQSVGYEMTFFAEKPAPIATKIIKNIHLVLSLINSLCTNLFHSY